MSDEAHPQKILVSQQEATDRKFIRSFLQTVGDFEVTEASNGIDLIKKLKILPDLILLDTQLKGDVIRALELMTRAPKLKNGNYI